MTMHEAVDAVEILRRAGLSPTRRRLTIADLVYGGVTVALTAEDLVERACDSGVCLDLPAAEAALEELRGAGVLPRVLSSASSDEAAGWERKARLLSAMGNPHRLVVLRELSEGERSVGELRRAVGLRPSALSQHLARLKADGLVRTRRAATRIFYSLAGDEAASVLRAVAA